MRPGPQTDPMTARYPYSAAPGQPSLQAEGPAVSNELVGLLRQKVEVVGAEVHNFELVDLSYAPEIAQVMLVRQQAEALVEARRLLVGSAVDMTHQALGQLEASTSLASRWGSDLERAAELRTEGGQKARARKPLAAPLLATPSSRATQTRKPGRLETPRISSVAVRDSDCADSCQSPPRNMAREICADEVQPAMRAATE